MRVSGRVRSRDIGEIMRIPHSQNKSSRLRLLRDPIFILRGSRDIFHHWGKSMESDNDSGHYRIEASVIWALHSLWEWRDETLFDLVITHYYKFAVRSFVRLHSPACACPFVRSFVAFFLPNGLFASFCFPQRFLARRSFRRSAFALGRLWI